MNRRLISLLLAISIILSFAFSAAALQQPEPTYGPFLGLDGALVILHTNDSHGRISPANGQAGFAAVSAWKKIYEHSRATVLVVDAGDTLHGMPAATLNRGADVVRIMNFVGYELMTPGNHDFNYGTDRLAELSEMMDFPIISANTFVKKTGKTLFDSSVVIEKGGLKLGFFGLTTPETAYKTNPKNVAAVEFRDPIEYAARQVAELKKKNVDYIIALAHIGVDAASEYTSDKIAAAVSGIDIIIDGHSHTAMIGGKPQDGSFELTPHGSTLIASAGEYINNIGIITIQSGQITAGLISSAGKTPADGETHELVEAILMLNDLQLSEVIGTTTVKLEGGREYSRSRETNLGNLAADAFRTATGADVAFTNGGGIRASIAAGEITKKDLVTVFPFGNYVVTKRVTGKALLAAMEHGVKDYPELSGGFPQMSGITFQIDASRPAGSRVVNARVGGTAISPGATYLLATNDFIAAGGDAYTMLDEFPIANEYGSMEEILIEYIKEHTDSTAEVDGRITVINAPSAMLWTSPRLELAS